MKGTSASYCILFEVAKNIFDNA